MKRKKKIIKKMVPKHDSSFYNSHKNTTIFPRLLLIDTTMIYCTENLIFKGDKIC